MRTLVTFILRLWVDPGAEGPAWEGRVENVASGERAHVRGPEELTRFLDAQTAGCRRPERGRASSPWRPAGSGAEQEE
ncbi:MAG: hypothetical protein JXA93_19820 [Anaerolineae bacterium]|nr:hypothetical protein [Anaerolineae bacterium]